MPADAVTASGSGVDPHISPAYADLQVARVARVTGLPEAQVRELVAAATDGRVLGFLGEPGVNVTRLNLAIAGARGHHGRMMTPWVRAASCGSTWARRPGSARPTPCSARRTAAPSGAPTSSSGWSRPTAGPRPPTLIEGLEVLPRRTVTYRGVELTELDVDAVLARAPQVVLVDELAHTNAPGSRHAKRWQDVEDLLDAGITVLTTVNIQHLESLNDVIERITGVRQQETVPDEVVRRAEQIELVDITPEALRRRMAHGNVYAAGAGRRGDGQLLPAAQPHRAARDGAAVAGRPGRGRPAAVPQPTSRSPTSGRPASGSSSR